MTFSHPKNRHSIRLKDYDYTQSGAYFITLVTYQRENRFGKIINREMKINEYWEIVVNEWKKSALIRAEIELDVYVVMPNHFHAIVYITDNFDVHRCRGDRPIAPTTTISAGPTPKSIGALVAGFKSAVTHQINQKCLTSGLPVWQRNYYEHIIRNEKSFLKIRRYILENPMQWEQDSLHVA